MGLPQQLRGFVQPHIRERGQDYFARRTVRIDRGDEWRVRAFVRGSQTYLVDLARDRRDRITAWCTCPFVEHGDACKHVWAALLACEEKGLLTGDGVAGQPTLALHPQGSQGPDDARGPDASRGDPDIDDSEDLDDIDDIDDVDDVDDLEADDGGVDPTGVDDPFEREWDHMLREARRGVPRFPRSGRPVPGRLSPQRTTRPPTWREMVARLPAAGTTTARPFLPRDGRREILYILDAQLTGTAGGMVIEVAWRDRKVNGEWGVPKTRSFLGRDIASAITPADEPALWMLWAVSHGAIYGGHRADLVQALESQRSQVRIPGPLVSLVLPHVCATGRCRARAAGGTLGTHAIEWDPGPPWTLWLDVQPRGDGGASSLDYSIRRGEERLAPSDVAVLTADGHLLTDTHVARFDHRGGFGWLSLLHATGPITVPAGESDALVAEIAARPGATPLELAPALGITERRVAPHPRLTVRPETAADGREAPFTADVTFSYDGVEIPWGEAAERVYRTSERTILLRDRDAERAALAHLGSAGLRLAPDYISGQAKWTLAAERLPEAVRTLSAHGWTVEASGRVYRHAVGTRTWVRSGIDWFDLEGAVDFGTASASIGEVLTALSRGEQTVRLSDGSAGILPEDWLAKLGRWAALGERQAEGVRFSASQAALLDALVAATPDIDVDAHFARAREELRTFDRIDALDPPASFHGELRGYQREGLGWIRFLERFGFGGCLADDMGLGKTVQVLAALAGRRAANPGLPPSLVVVPRSLVFNWLRETSRFAPDLRVLDHTGAGRARNLSDVGPVDLIVTTYGTLRRDAAQLAGVALDYIVLDEAHAIKNVGSQTAKTVRLLRGGHRLALTGTPIQNHLGELWSLFEFLNPGILGRSSAFSRLLDKDTLDDAGRQLLARAVRPFVLRRTKADVARDLPAKVEDTIVCRLGPDERRFYDELRAHYRQALGARIDQEGWARSKILVLEALLRLRQAACHPGLVDATWRGESSAKLDVLVSQLREVREEGHKAIVFSQFVKFLDRVRAALDREGVPYEYLDGKTRDREARVDRFQTDPECTLFLISLKAGGLGLNLTAAEYVFLLDPWWNPAIEAQAIDRAHRIGQTRHVFAYRLIAEDTIEEKVLELQERKRQVADAILGEDAGALKQLTREDLELLLS